MSKKYEKPSIKFEEIRISEKIATDCWAEVNDDLSVYYNSTQTGLCEIILKKGSKPGCGNAVLDYININGVPTTSGDIYDIVKEKFDAANGPNTHASGFTDDRPSY